MEEMKFNVHAAIITLSEQFPHDTHSKAALS